ncbi:hypothetical protein D3C83_212150 [compost metagenome]
MSLMAACAVAKFAPKMPSIRRERMTISSEVAAASMRKLTNVDNWLMSRSGLRP